MLRLTLIDKHIYKNRKINTTFNKRAMKGLIKLCTKDIHFNFNGTRYVEKDGDGFSVSTRMSHYPKIITTSSILETLCQ